ncbi:kinase-like domain-containing protein, partial [Mycena alexandri]
MFDYHVPHLGFLATRLLPCGSIDKPIQKFTGNSDCGNAPTDAMTEQLHAFSHFIGVYSDGDAMLCDLQGLYDRRKVMVLIDPQMHTGETNSENRIYWDNGPVAIKQFMDHHLRVCSENGVCNRLGLQELQYEPASPNSPRPQTPPPQSNIRPRSVSHSPRERKKPHRAGTFKPSLH